MTVRPVPKAVSFDGDMTLWDFNTAMRHALARVLKRLRQRLPTPATGALTVDRLITIRDVVAREARGIRLSHEAIRLAAFERTVELVGGPNPALARELNALYFRHRFDDIALYDDTLVCLEQLSPAYALGLVSNGNSYPERCGLAGRFDFVLFAQSLGIEKPNPGIFLAACRQAGCAPQELVHVGDSIETDVAGAKALGAVSVWLNRNGKQNPTNIAPDHEITTLLELPAIIEMLAGEPARRTNGTAGHTPGPNTRRETAADAPSDAHRAHGPRVCRP